MLHGSGRSPGKGISSVFLGFAGGSDGKESTCNMGRPGYDHWCGDHPLVESTATHSNILARRIPMDSGAWQATVRGVTKNQTRLSNEAQYTEQGSGLAVSFPCDRFLSDVNDHSLLP